MSIESFRRYHHAAQCVGLDEDVRLGRLKPSELEAAKKRVEVDADEMECVLANMIYKVRGVGHFCSTGCQVASIRS